MSPAASLLEGLPDLGAWEPNSVSLPAFGRPGRFALGPVLALRRRPDGRPWFRLDIARQADLSDPVALLDVGLEVRGAPGSPGDAQPAPWGGGWLLLAVQGPGTSDVLVTADLVTSGAGQWQALVDVPIGAALLLRAALLDDAALTVRAVMHLGLVGVAARAEAIVSFDPATAGTALRAAAGAHDRPTRGEVAATVRSRPEAFGLPAPVAPTEDVVEAVTDRLLARLTTTVPPENLEQAVGHAVTETSTGTLAWDLREPASAVRYAACTLDPVSSARELMAGAGPEDLVGLHTVPELDTGHREVRVRTTLATVILGVDDLSVRLQLPAAPPRRAQAQSCVVSVRPGAGAQVATLRMSPDERAEIKWRTAVIPSAPALPRVLLGPGRAGTASGVLAGPDDLPVRLAWFSASDALLGLAAVEADVCWTDVDGRLVRWQLTLDRLTTRIAVAVPSAAAPTATVALRLVDGVRGHVLDLGLRAFGPTHLDSSALPQLGAREVSLVCDVAAGITVAAFELCPDDDGSPTPPAVVTFTPAVRSRPWSYVSTDPFRAGVRYRQYRPSDRPPLPWSVAPVESVAHVEPEPLVLPSPSPDNPPTPLTAD